MEIMPATPRDAEEQSAPTLDEIVAKAADGGLEALSKAEVIWLESWLWDDGNEEFAGHDFDALIYPDWSSEYADDLEDHVTPERLEALRDGAAPTRKEKQLFRKQWRKRMEEQPEDDWVPGLWECRVAASYGTAIRTIRKCWGNGWEADRTLIDIQPW
jgi:hypothetical protein